MKRILTGLLAIGMAAATCVSFMKSQCMSLASKMY